jgi:tRNA uracil 4-sulfurtransferase
MRPVESMRYLIGRYHEIALKGGNQWRFVNQLKTNLRNVFGDFQLGKLRSVGPRLILPLPDAISDEIAIARARNFTPRSFCVRARREDKRFPMTSPEIDREVGAAIVEALGFKVDLHDPELTISIEIMQDAALVAAGKIRGPGGLPVGATGRGLALLSGGIDSPVAAYRMMKRGLWLNYVHFHGQPLVSSASQEKALELGAHLVRHQGQATLMLVPFGILQREIVANTLRPLRVILYRRFMMRIATALATRSGATVLVTGESLGQVASQTLENMAVIEKAAALPILRPLVGMDKNEIVDQARALGTFETSILPDQDCCTLFMPAHPETHARLAEVEAAESRFDIERMIADAVNATEVVRLSFPPRPNAAATATSTES